MSTRVITCCAVLLHATKCYYRLCSVVACYLLPRVIICGAVLLDGTKSYYMLSSVVACNLELLHDVQCG